MNRTLSIRTSLKNQGMSALECARRLQEKIMSETQPNKISRRFDLLSKKAIVARMLFITLNSVGRVSPSAQLGIRFQQIGQVFARMRRCETAAKP